MKAVAFDGGVVHRPEVHLVNAARRKGLFEEWETICGLSIPTAMPKNDKVYWHADQFFGELAQPRCDLCFTIAKLSYP